MTIEQAAEIIKQGGIVAFPTETVYGLGADAWNGSAISKIYKIKGRPADNPLIVHLHEKKQIHDFCSNIPEHAHTLIDTFWPGPLTLVLKKRQEVLDAVTAGLDTVALRIPDHSIALDLIRRTGPLVAPSANRSGKPSPTKAEHILSDFGNACVVLDGNATKIGLESTVIDLSDEEPIILRPGMIGREEISTLLGVSVKESSPNPIHSPKSPGQKYSHYTPDAKVRWLLKNESPNDDSTLYLLQSRHSSKPNTICYNFDLEQLAKELYDRFRLADIQKYKEVVVEPLEEHHPLYAALNNRILKAIGN
jgi:L-threonylcarbamoyladenylate synthase